MWSILAAAVATAPHSHKASGKIGWEHQQWHAAVDRHLYNSKHTAPLGLAQARYVEQDQDNFDGSNSNSWMQAYYVNDTFWTPGSDAPVFLCVGGEGPPLDGSAVLASPHCNIAVEHLQATKALMFAVEHRFYGCHNMSACPVQNFDGPTPLKFLSSRQALADLANFHQFATGKYGLTSPGNKWISFGGSYPGMLAGWFRIKYPHLVHGSIASSAPVHAKLDMQGYNNVAAEAYSVSDNNVGGSEACQAAIADGHRQIGIMFNTTAGRATLAALFGNTPEWYADYNNQAQFAGNGVAYFPSQGNDPSCAEPGCNIGSICTTMTNTATGTTVQRLAKLSQNQAKWVPSRESVKSVKSSAGEPDYWGYQTCAEFGFYQTCEVGSECFYTQGYVTLASMDAFCQSEFNISVDKVSANINLTNAVYGGVTPVGSCLTYPNGEVDPWHALSILEAPSAGFNAIMVPGASHHAWTHPSLPTDQASVVAARQTIREQVDAYLGQPCDV